jgi:hypothetical protein
MCGSRIFLRFAWNILESRARVAAATCFSKTPWPGDPRINIQNDKGKAKAYQVRQVLLAIDKLKEFSHEADNEKDAEG